MKNGKRVKRVERATVKKLEKRGKYTLLYCKELEKPLALENHQIEVEPGDIVEFERDRHFSGTWIWVKEIKKVEEKREEAPEEEKPWCEKLGTLEVRLEEVYFDDDIYPRVGVDEELVEKYASLLEEGVELPPVKAVEKPSDTGRYLCLDGKHRYLAHEKAGRETIKVEVYKIPDKWLLYYASRWNAKHGKQLSKEDVRKTAEKMYKLGYSVKRIAIALGYSDRWIRELLKEIREDERAKVAELYGQGVPPKEIVEKLGLKLEAVEGYIKQLSTLEVTSSVDTPLKEKAVRLRKEGKSLREIAKKLGVSKSTIQKWLKELEAEKEEKLVEEAVDEQGEGARVSVEAAAEKIAEEISEELVEEEEEGPIEENLTVSEAVEEESKVSEGLPEEAQAVAEEVPKEVSKEEEELRKEREELLAKVKSLERRVEELEEENRELRNQVISLRMELDRSKAVFARRKVEVLGHKEVEYNPFSILPVKREGVYLCPLCSLEFRVVSLEDYIEHLKWHQVNESLCEEMLRFLKHTR